MKAKSLYIQKLAYDENTGNEIIGLFPSEANPAIVSSYTYDAKRMGGAPTLTATIYSSEPLQWKKEEFVEYNGDRFFASYTPNSTKDNSSRMWKSEITFTSRRELLDNTLFFDVVVDDVDTQNKDRYRSNQTKFTFGGTIHEFVARINSSMAYCGLYRPTDEHKGYYVVIDEGYGTDEVKEVSFEDQYLTDVLQLINTTFELDYYWDGNVCHVGKVQHDLTDTPIKYGSSDALISVSKENANYKIVDMITGYGSSDNLPYYYPNDDEFGEAVFNTENISKDKVSVELSKFLKDSRYNDNLILYKSKEGKSYNGSVDVSSHTFDRFTTPSNLTQADNQSNPTVTCRFSFSIPISAIKGQSVDLTNLNFISELNSSVSRKDYITNVGNAVKSIYIFKGKELYKTISNKTSFGSVATYTFEEDGDFTLSIESEFSYKCKVYKNSAGINDFYGADSWNAAFSGSIEFLYESKSEYEWKNGDKYIPYGDAGINVSEIGEANCIEYDYQFVKDGDRYGFNKVYTGTEDNAVKVIVTDRVWIAPSSVLMPSIYRNTKGAERFYYALNNTHKLPSGNGYYEFVNLYKKGNPHQGTVTFDGIKPTIKGIVNAEGQLFGEIADVAFDKEDSDVKDSDGKHIHNYFYIKLHKFNGDFGFDLFAHALASESAKINLIKSNGCPACSFVIGCYWDSANNKCYNNVLTDGNGNLKSDSGKMNSKGDYILNDTYVEDNKSNQDSTKEELWICVQKDTSTLGIVMPNASAGFKPQKGDLFVITGIKPPKVLVTAAEKRLDDALVKHMSENNTDQFNYSVKFSRIFLQENPDFASKLNENAKLSIQIQGDSDSDGNLISHEVFVSNYSVKVDNDELAEVEIELVNSLEVTKSDTKQIIDAVKGEAVKSLSSMVGGSNTNSFNASITDKMYLSKLNDDTAKGTITWEKIQKLLSGLQSGEFESGLYGHGAQVDKRGDAEFNSIFAREFIRAPKFVFNEIEVTKAEHWNTNGYGTIKTVDTQKHIISLKLEENDYGSLMVGDICRGIYADLRDTYKSSQNNEGTLDENNFIVRKGFFTSYFYVKKVITAQKGEFIFEYGKKSDAYPDPCPFMDFAQYGNFNNTQRQSSMYFSSRGRSYIEVLEGVNSWEIQAEHRVCRYGDLTGLFIRKDDGTMTNLKGNGLFAQNHVYLGGAVITLSNISDLDDLVLKLSTYDVTLSAYSSVITVDDMGNVIDGLWTQDSEGGNKQYRISTAVFVSQAGKPLLLEDESSKYCTEGHYRVYATGDACDVSVANGTVFVTGIDNIKDGVAGSGDDSNFDYDAMRKMTDCKVTIVVELEGKGTRTLDFPIRIHHDSLPFMVCDLTNEHAAVSWHTKHSHYAGLPLQTEVNMMYKNTPYDISELSASLPSSVSKYLKATVTDKAKAKVVTIDKVSDFASDVLPTSFDITITAVAIYAGARYEYTKVLTVSKTSDYVIYELVPSVNSVTVDSADRVSPGSVSCDVWATSSDDKRYKVTSLPSGFGLYYSKNENALSSISLGGSVSVSASDNKVSFVLKHTEGGVEYIDDKEDIPVVSDGKESAVVYSSDNIVSIPVDVNGKILSALNASVSFRIFAGDKELTVNSVAISSLPSNRAVSASVSNKVLVLKCGAGTSFGKEEVSYTLSVQGANGNVTHTGYTTVKVLPNVMGKSVKDVNTYYALNDSATSKPADSSFTYDTISSAVISSNANKYLWSGDKITYDDNTTVITGIYMVGRCSELATVTEQYAKTTTNSAPSSGWSETYPSVGKGVYVWSRDKITWKNGSVTYSAVQLVAYIGNDGKDGNDSTVPGPKGDSITITSTSVTYQIHDSGTTPPTGTWSLSIPSVTDEKPYLWTKTYVLYSDDTSTTSFSVATKGKQGASVTGRTGSVVRSSVWKTGVAFYCGDTLVNGQYYVDVVYVADDTETDGWAKYQCIKNHTSSSSITTSNGTYWKRMSSASIYAPLIVGKNASIDFAQGQQFNLMEGNSVWGSFRYVNTGDSPALWLGGMDSRYAPFSVTKNGYIKATSGQIGSFHITEFTDPVSKLKFYNLHAMHDSFGVIEACEVNIGAEGISVNAGNPSKGAYGRVKIGHGGGGSTGTGFTYSNVLNVNVLCSNGNETGAAYISAEGRVENVKALSVYAGQGTHNYAVYADAGMIRGALCPRVKVISSNYILKEDDNVIICTNSGAIDIQFPSAPAVGQSYIFIQVDGDLYFKSSAPFRGRLSGASCNSKTKGQINFFFFDGSYWSNSYAN